MGELTRQQLLAIIDVNSDEGISLAFSGKSNARRIARKVRPRILSTVSRLGAGDPTERAANLLLEGDNLQAMVTQHRIRGRVDLIVADPPYNTGNDFRYNDRWDHDPNDPGLGEVVSSDDTAKHTKWMRFMWPRLQMMKSMLRPGGVLAICIDHREVFRLGQMLDELFRQRNRIAIINWEKAAASRPDNNHVSTSTEYVLVYAKDAEKAVTNSFERKDIDNIRYSNPDNDPEGDWREGNLTARTYSSKDDYAIQSPFTGDFHYPAGNGAWRHPKRNVLQWLQEWGAVYEQRDIGDGRAKALVLKDSSSRARRTTAERGPRPVKWCKSLSQRQPSSSF